MSFQSFYSYASDLAAKSIKIFWELARVMIPIMILMRIAESLGIIEDISPILSPLMEILNLPPEVAIVSLTAIFIGVYGAIATLPLLLSYDLTAAQVTAICAIILIAHAIPIEQAIVKQAGGSFWGTSLLRLVGAFLAAYLIHIISDTTGYLSHTQSFYGLEQFGSGEQDHFQWAIASTVGMVQLFAILVALLMLIDLFNKVGITKIIEWLFKPIMRLSGLHSSVTSITTAGILLGLTFGSGLIIAERDNPKISQKARSYALYWLSMCHGLIEDVALMVLIGGDFWMLFAGRIVLTLFLVRMIMLYDVLRIRTAS